MAGTENDCGGDSLNLFINITSGKKINKEG